MHTLISEEIKHFTYSPSILISVISVDLNNFAEVQLMSMMEFFFNTFPCETMMASLLKCVLDSTADVFFGRKRAFYLNTSTKTDTLSSKNNNISSLKWDFKNLRHNFLCGYSLSFYFYIWFQESLSADQKSLRIWTLFTQWYDDIPLLCLNS